jgi:polyhydroxyalkanoate synthesis regulator phasin
MSRARLFTVGAVALIVVAVTGAAVAATNALSPKEESKAILDDAAKQLGVKPSELDAALKQALKNRVDAAVKAGRLTKARADRIKERIDAGDVPFLVPGRGFGFGPGHGRFGHHGPGGHVLGLDAAASYLGLTEAKLREALESGKTLAQMAKDRGKSVDGLVDAMLAEKAKRLDEAVAAGRITKAERTEFLAGLKERTTNLVNGRFPPHHHEFRDRGARLPFPTA